MAEIKGLTELNGKLSDRLVEAEGVNGASVIVGYTANYAVYVHENRQAVHPVGKAGFLLDPARRLEGEVRRVIAETYRRTRDAKKSLIVGALLIQRESQLECPVDTGNLRASAFTKEEK